MKVPWSSLFSYLFFVSQLCSKFFLNNYKAPWQQHLKDTFRHEKSPQIHGFPRFLISTSYGGGGAWMERCVNINPKDKLKEETSYDKEVVIYLKDSIRKVICLYTYNKH